MIIKDKKLQMCSDGEVEVNGMHVSPILSRGSICDLDGGK